MQTVRPPHLSNARRLGGTTPTQRISSGPSATRWLAILCVWVESQRVSLSPPSDEHHLASLNIALAFACAAAIHVFTGGPSTTSSCLIRSVGWGSLLCACKWRQRPPEARPARRRTSQRLCCGGDRKPSRKAAHKSSFTSLFESLAIWRGLCVGSGRHGPSGVRSPAAAGRMEVRP